MPNSPKPRFGDLERAVLELLWEAPDPVTVREVHARLSATREIAYTTVMTVLDRLSRKGLVVQERQGRAFLYEARGTRAEMTADMLLETLHELSPDDRGSALVAFVGEATAEDVAALRHALAELPD